MSLPDHVKSLRNTAAATFLGFLIGLAYQEAVAPAGQVLSARGVTLVDGALFAGFVLLGLMTFMSGSYYIAGTTETGLVWFAWFVVLTFEGVLLIFMARVASAEATRAAEVGFVDLLFVFVLIDAFWNVVSLVRVWTNPDLRSIALAFSIVAVVAAVAIPVIWWLPMRSDGDAELVSVAALLLCVFAVQATLMVKNDLV